MKSVKDYSHPHLILWQKNGQVKHYDMLDLSFEFLEGYFDYILFLKFDAPSNSSNFDIDDIIKSLDLLYERYIDSFIILTEKKAAPPFSEWLEEYVYSFSCTFSDFKALISSAGTHNFWNDQLLFKLLDKIFERKHNFKNMLVRQIPFKVEEPLELTPCDVTIPYKGNYFHLPNVLSYLNNINKLNINVGIGEEINNEIDVLKTNYPKVSFYDSKADSSDPSVIRNWMVDRSKNELTFFQDPDDISCADRFEKIAAHMKTNKVQICGSHEIWLDYLTLQVQAIRFPQHVNAALEKEIGYSLFHHSSAITNKDFSIHGKLFGEMTLSNGRKIMVNNDFSEKIAENIDEFLYIKRNRPDFSAPDIHKVILSAENKREIAIMNRDFERVKRGEITLEELCLMPQKTSPKITMKKL